MSNELRRLIDELNGKSGEVRAPTTNSRGSQDPVETLRELSRDARFDIQDPVRRLREIAQKSRR